ncbi:MAG: sugar phosphate isomerase/epimerase [Pedosphaera sp.]|nr:sugar phosphate isomerase/epimerase [Pedosphaera sp.]MSU43027.1 sugar phosphate isomerase/epimerase [Pedosphaera sp.]
MAKPTFHPSIEGAQHGPKGLEKFLAFAKKSGAAGAQPSNYMMEVEGSDGTKFKPAKKIREAFDKHHLHIDGISSHCPFWVHTSAWSGTKSGHPFIHGPNQAKSPKELEKFYEDYLLRLMDLSAELNVKVMPMFWGVAFGWELASGYPWGFWAGPGFDLLKEGKERFANKTKRLREHANQLGIYLAHEIHPGTAAMCAEDFGMLVEICDGDKCLAVNADPSHCWEGEDWEKRFSHPAVRDRVVACHVKNFTIHHGVPVRKMESNWKQRAMQFTDLATGDLNMTRYAELLINIGYPKRYCQAMHSATAPLIVEAESNYRDGDATSAEGIGFVRDHLCFPVAAGSFEDAMGA